jgi:hypothetical protein
MMTSWSLNCSRMSSQMGVGGSSASAVVSLRQPLCASYTCCLVQHTIFTMLLAQSPDLLLREALVLCYLEIPERLCRRFGVCILHASSNAPPRGLLVAQSLLVLLYVCETNTEAVVERVVGMWMVWCGGKVRTRGEKNRTSMENRRDCAEGKVGWNVQILYVALHLRRDTRLYGSRSRFVGAFSGLADIRLHVASQKSVLRGCISR